MEIPAEEIDHAKKMILLGKDPDTCSIQDLQRMAKRWEYAWIDPGYRKQFGLVDPNSFYILAEILPDKLKTWDDGKLLKFAAPYLNPMKDGDLYLWLQFMTKSEARHLNQKIHLTGRQRIMALQHLPALVWKFYPPARDSEIIIAIIKDPTCINDIPYRESEANLKWLALALRIAIWKDKVAIAQRFGYDCERAMKIYGNFWNKILGKKQ